MGYLSKAHTVGLTLINRNKMQRIATTILATLALAAHGLTLRGATADHGRPAEAEQPTLAELDVPYCPCDFEMSKKEKEECCRCECGRLNSGLPFWSMGTMWTREVCSCSK